MARINEHFDIHGDGFVEGDIRGQRSPAMQDDEFRVRRNLISTYTKLKLRASWSARMHREQSQDVEDETDLKINALKAEIAQIVTVRKDRVFDSEVTEDESIIIKKRVKLQQLLFAQYSAKESIRRVKRIKQCFGYLSGEEISEAFTLNGLDEDDILLKFTDESFLKEIRKSIALRYTKATLDSMTVDEQKAYKTLLEKRSRPIPKITSRVNKQKAKRSSKLKLDEAIAQLEDSSDPSTLFAGWSGARVKAYAQIHSKPNTYYYRFNDPGVKQGSGGWDKDEAQLFLKRLKEVGADGQWGIFSTAIPGRVGYQCSNYYRHLIKTGSIVDHNYTIDEKGGLHYQFKKRESVQNTSKIGKRSGRDYDSLDQDDSGNWHSHTDQKSKKDKMLQITDINPLPGFIDPITLEEVIKPAISPFGHVMGYCSWSQCLDKNICPLSKNAVTKRELVLLTIDNIEEYRFE